MKVTERDVKLFSMLNDFGVMATKQITREVFRGIDKKTVLRRLRVLEDEDFIKRIPGLVNNENAWALTIDGARFVGDRPPRWNFSRFNLDHDVRLTGLRLQLQRLGVVYAWIPEHEIRHKVLAREGLEYGKRQSIADGILNCKVKGLRRRWKISALWTFHSRQLKHDASKQSLYRNQSFYRAWREKRGQVRMACHH